MTIGDRIRARREELGMSQEELALKLGYKSRSTINKIESGGRNLRQSKILAIAKALDTTTDYIMGWEEEEPAEVQPVVELCPAVPIYNALNKQGQAEYIRYGRYLTSQPEYLADEAEPQIEYIRHYLTPAAAGYASPIEGEDYDMMERGLDVPHKADFAIDISGDSMEPYIHDGQTVYVQRGADIEDMDVGIFFVDGDVYCKQYCLDYNGDVHLLSANPNREDANVHIRRDSTRNLVCFGKVILPHRLPAPIYNR